jgi:hypothetical protein
MAKENIWRVRHNLSIGETKEVSIGTGISERITRVPHGWIYVYNYMGRVTSTFVPRLIK